MKITVSSILVLVNLFFISCNVVKQNKKIINKYNCELLTSNFVDSLKNKGIDTILYFSNKCVGCINGNIETNYIFWKENHITKVIKFDSYLGKQSMKECDDIFKFYPIEILRNETLNKPTFELSHYHYYKIKLLTPNSFDIEIPDYFLEVNNEKNISNWIYRIESTLYKTKI